jgi:hypothetical protein
MNEDQVKRYYRGDAVYCAKMLLLEYIRLNLIFTVGL